MRFATTYVATYVREMNFLPRFLLGILWAFVFFVPFSLGIAVESPGAETVVSEESSYPPPSTASVFPQRVIDLAMATDLIDYDPFPSKKAAGWPNEVLTRAPAFYFLSLVAFQCPEAIASDGKKVPDRVVSHIRSLVQPGNEPNAAGGITGWADGQTALGLALARRSPTVWDNVSSDEKERVEWVMRALAVAAHWTLGDGINPTTLLWTQKNFDPKWPPNHWMGQYAVIIAAGDFFGVDELDDIFLAFDQSEYLGHFKKFGFTNFLSNWNLDAERMNPAIRRPHLSRDQKSLFDPVGYLEKPFKWTFGRKVADASLAARDETGASRGKILSGSSPFLGQTGMIVELEFGASRSSVRYAFDVWRNVVPIVSFLMARDQWSGAVAEQLDPIIRIGSEDFLYKLLHGYKDWANNVEKGETWSMTRMGFPVLKTLWRRQIAPDLQPARVAAQGIEAESMDYSTPRGGVSSPGGSGGY